ncbi:hypothetical protein GCM10023172_36670 [Hymenobacter ginsengisoli]|uniref:AB hydrolase-1 domain-containing protein n=1 Tax=Hymenobacter ginsengisoli TaxID=1051626 RepID=A0ABP8QQ50_9BACT|nr:MULTISPECIES: hypothetical protein [unclassified Hymenobacter]MBO2033953.1 hypothetical protein [Hymenobacter sp. BT559]
MSDSAADQFIARHEASGRYVDVDGGRTFALDYGQGEAVLCIHGVPTSSYLFRKMLRSLESQGLRVIEALAAPTLRAQAPVLVGAVPGKRCHTARPGRSARAGQERAAGPAGRDVRRGLVSLRA